MCRSQTTAASKLLPTNLPCGTARSRPLTLPSSAPSPGLAKRSQGCRATRQGLFEAAARRKRRQTYPELGASHQGGHFFFARLFHLRHRVWTPATTPLQAPGGTAGTSALSLTAGGYGELPAHVGQDLVQLRRIPTHIALAGKWELEEGRGNARCAATAGNPDQRATQADHAAGRSAAGTAEDLCYANKRSHVAASLPELVVVLNLFVVNLRPHNWGEGRVHNLSAHFLPCRVVP